MTEESKIPHEETAEYWKAMYEDQLRRKRVAQENLKNFRESGADKALSHEIYAALTSEEVGCLRKLGQWALHPSTFGHQIAIEGERKIREWIDAYEGERPLPADGEARTATS